MYDIVSESHRADKSVDSGLMLLNPCDHIPVGFSVFSRVLSVNHTL